MESSVSHCGCLCQGGKSKNSLSEARIICSDSWARFIEEIVTTSDALGHGPDVGSDEWKSVVEFKLGIRDKPDVPKRDSENWCRYIEQIIRNSRASIINEAKRHTFCYNAFL